MSFIQRSLVSGISRLLPEAVFYKKTSAKAVALTIDDVGDADTLKILDVIDRFNQRNLARPAQVRATFFIITDDLDDSGSILGEILKRGHEIGNHGQTDHRHAALNTAEFKTEINQAHQILSKKSNADIKWFRPGQVLYNQGMLNTLTQMPGYQDKFALASVFPLDTLKQTSHPIFTAKYMSSFIFPGSILILHGGSPERTANTVEALDRLLIECKRKAYEVLTLTQLWESSL